MRLRLIELLSGRATVAHQVSGTNFVSLHGTRGSSRSLWYRKGTEGSFLLEFAKNAFIQLGKAIAFESSLGCKGRIVLGSRRAVLWPGAQEQFLRLSAQPRT